VLYTIVRTHQNLRGKKETGGGENVDGEQTQEEEKGGRHGGTGERERGYDKMPTRPQNHLETSFFFLILIRHTRPHLFYSCDKKPIEIELHSLSI
jgi:hypothetical protein